MNSTSKKTLGLVQIALFAAIIFVLAMVPGLGYIPLGVIRATTIHIPVIIGALVLGPKKGAALGGVFGLTSFINNTINPTVTSFVFSPILGAQMQGMLGVLKSTVICFVPRVLIGVVAYFVYRFVRKWMKNCSFSMTAALACAGVAGSLTNTLLVMNLIYLFFGDTYASVKDISYQTLYGVIITIIGTNGIPEAIVAGILVTAIGKVFFKSKIMN